MMTERTEATAGMTDAQRLALVERLSDVSKDPGWSPRNARDAAWAVHWWMIEQGYALAYSVETCCIDCGTYAPDGHECPGPRMPKLSQVGWRDWNQGGVLVTSSADERDCEPVFVIEGGDRPHGD